MKTQLRSMLLIGISATTCASLNASTALIDFGSGFGTTSGNINNINISSPTLTTSFANVSLSSGSSSLITDTGASSGWSIGFQARKQDSIGGQIGTAGAGGVYTGTVGTVSTDIFGADPLKDGLFLNNSAILRISITGLDNTKTYNLSAFGGRDSTATAAGGIWALVTGTATASQYFQNGSNTATSPIPNAFVVSTGTNQGDLFQWSGITPSSGTITLAIATQNLPSNAIAQVNALAITQVPEPSTTLLGGLGLLTLLRRRR